MPKQSTTNPASINAKLDASKTPNLARFDAAVDSLRSLVPALEGDARDASKVADHELAAYLGRLGRAAHDLVTLVDADFSRQHADFAKSLRPAQRARAGR